MESPRHAGFGKELSMAGATELLMQIPEVDRFAGQPLRLPGLSQKETLSALCRIHFVLDGTIA